MSVDQLSFVSVADSPAVEDEMERLSKVSWPEFMLHASGGAVYWQKLYSVFPDYQFGVFDNNGNIIAAGWSLPLRFDAAPKDLPDDGWDWAMCTGFLDAKKNIPPNVQSALAIVVHPDHRGRGLSGVVIEHMKQIGRSNHLSALIAPVRPNLKSRYPLVPMDRYIRWMDREGLPFDPWMRVHSRLNAQVIKVCNRAMQIYGTVEQWQEWTAMRFPESGKYTVPGALTPVDVNVEKDICTYIEPNVWMWHEMNG